MPIPSTCVQLGWPVKLEGMNNASDHSADANRYTANSVAGAGASGAFDILATLPRYVDASDRVPHRRHTLAGSGTGLINAPSRRTEKGREGQTAPVRIPARNGDPDRAARHLPFERVQLGSSEIRCSPILSSRESAIKKYVI